MSAQHRVKEVRKIKPLKGEAQNRDLRLLFFEEKARRGEIGRLLEYTPAFAMSHACDANQTLMGAYLEREFRAPQPGKVLRS